MKATAHIRNGLSISKAIPVTEFVVWIDRSCHHKPTPETLIALLADATASGRMTVTEKGEVDGFDSIPLYTNGQESLFALEVDGKIVWEVFEGAFKSYSK